MGDEDIYSMLTTFSELALMVRDNTTETDDERALQMLSDLGLLEN